MEADKAVSRKEKEIIYNLKGEAYKMQRRHWMKQLQPNKARRKPEKDRETKKDREEL